MTAFRLWVKKKHDGTVHVACVNMRYRLAEKDVARERGFEKKILVREDSMSGSLYLGML